MTIIRAIGGVLQAILSGIMAVLMAIVSLLTCGKAGGGRTKAGTSHV